jgi:hypothetical protein
MKQYRVKNGDTLSKIATHQLKASNLWPEIAKANDIRYPFTIFEGMRLVIPTVDHPRAHVSVHAPAQNIHLRDHVSVHAPAHNFQDHVPAFLGNSPASGVRMPALKIPFEGKKTSPDGRVTITAKGELTIQQEGVLSEVEMGTDGPKGSVKYGDMEVQLSGAEFNQLNESSIKIKKAYKSRIAELIGDATFSWNSVTGTAEIKCKLAYEAKLNGEKFISFSCKPNPPSGVVFSFESKEVKGEGFDGKIAFEVEIKNDPKVNNAKATERVSLSIKVEDIAADKFFVTTEIRAPVPGTTSWTAAIAAVMGCAAYVLYGLAFL